MADNVLGELDGFPVTKMAVAFREAGDGFTDELDIAPNPHETGTETWFVFRCVTGPIDHEPLDEKGKKPKGQKLVDGFDSFKRIEDQIVLQVTEVAKEDVGEFIERANRRIMAARAERDAEESRRKEEERKRAEEEAGVTPLFNAPDGDEEGDDDGGDA